MNFIIDFFKALLSTKLNFKALSSFLFLSLLLLQFNNCSDVQFSPIQQKLAKTGVAPERSHEEVVEQIHFDCENGVVVEKLVTINFPAQNQTCDWGNGGNLSIKNGVFRARVEQDFKVSMPVNSVICNMDFSSAATSMRYDDHLIFSLNSTVLMTTYKGFVEPYSTGEIEYISNHRDFSHENVAELYLGEALLAKKNGHAFYDWQSLSDTYWFGRNSWKDPGYCLGDALMSEVGGVTSLSSCQWPKTQELGAIELDIHPSLIQSIMAFDLSSNDHIFKLTTVGDNDSTDCQHDEDVSIDLMIQYVQK
ncbi:MAG: hypothetical protein HOO06_02065 [Bdellovibrionaceae bacterium]|jgi:hypothetical protein|nr:hypothetical protein [Pseudobdellovibrionaceae bacterium]